MGCCHLFKDLTAHQHKSSCHTLGADKAHTIHREFAVLVVVQRGDVCLGLAAGARDASDDALLGVGAPRHQAENVVRLEVDVRVNEHEVVAVGL